MLGHVACLVTAGVEVPGASGSEGSRRGVYWVGGSGPARKRIRLNRKKTLHTSLVWGFNVVHECGRDCVQWTVRYLLPLTLRGGVLIRVMWILFLLRSGLGLDDFLVPCRPTLPGLHVF